MKQLGYYSYQAVSLGYDTYIYLNEERKEVTVTTVCDPGTEDQYTWPDKKFVGNVTKWVRTVKGYAVNTYMKEGY